MHALFFMSDSFPNLSSLMKTVFLRRNERCYRGHAMDQLSSSLVLDARSGSEEALNRLFAQCGERLLGFIRMRLGPSLRSRLESRDILQASLLKAFRSIDSVEASGSVSLMAWLARIAENEIRDRAEYFTRLKRDAARELPVDEHGARLVAQLRSQSSRLALAQETLRLEQALDELSEEHRQVILLRYFHELGFREIGEALDRSPDAARMLLARAMAALTLRMKGPA
jgi:RNA polymerase sigma-70 factor (ECF subfamily)